MCDEMGRWTRIDFKLWMIEAADHQCEALTWYRVERVSARALRVWLTLKEEERQVRSLLRRAKNDTTPIRPKGRRDAKAEMIRRRSLCIDTTSSFHLYTHAGTRVHVPSSRKLHLYVFLVLTQRLQQSRAEQNRTEQSRAEQVASILRVGVDANNCCKQFGFHVESGYMYNSLVEDEGTV